jgi:hypothetical protein
MVVHDEFNILYCNVRGLRNKYTELQKLLESLNISIFIFQETKLTENIIIKFEGYETFNHYHNSKKPRGGTIIGFKNNIDHSKCASTQLENSEYVSAQFKYGKQKINLFSIYNHPHDKLDSNNLEDIDNRNEPAIIIGDLNAKHKMMHSSSTNENGKILYNLLLDSNLIMMNQDKPTHVNEKSIKLDILDYVLTTTKAAKLIDECTTLDEIGSDHFPIIIKLHKTGKVTTNNIPLNVKNYNYNKADWNIYQTYLEEHDDDIDINSDVNTMAKQVSDLIIKAADTSIPTKKTIQSRSPLPPYIIASIKLRRHYHRKYIENRDKEFKALYNRQTNIIRRQIKSFNNRKYSDLINNINENDKTGKVFWKSVNTILKRKRTDTSIQKITHNNQNYTSSSDIAKCFTNHFSTIFSDVRDRNYDNNWKDHIDHLIEDTPQIPNKRDNIALDIGELNSIIKKLNTSKACGLDNIHNHLLKHLPENIRFLLIILFEKSINSGTVPQEWKHALIRVIPKPNKDKTLTTSYRPISLLSCFGKILEKLINNILSKFLEENNLLLPEQNGFRQYRSTTDNLTKLCIDLNNLKLKQSKTNKILISVFLDIEKCFDRVWINGLKYKITQLNINNNIKAWLCNFLTNRTFSVKIDQYISENHPIKAGVPQGAILSPTLFALYSSDLPRNNILLNNTKIFAYADDFGLYNMISIKHHYIAREKLQESMDELTKWGNKWRIRFNPTKCNSMMFYPKHQKREILEEKYYNPITINNQDIPKTNEIKFLGLNFQENSDWTIHLEYVSNRATSILNGLKIARSKGVYPEIIIQLYTTFIRSIITYAAPAWYYLLTNTQKITMERIQNKAIKIAYNLPKWTKTETVIKLSELPSINTFIKSITTRYIDKIRTNKHMEGYVDELEILMKKDTFNYQNNTK